MSLEFKISKLVYFMNLDMLFLLSSAEAAAPILCNLMRRLTHWKRPWCWERLKAGGEGEDRGWDGWMASLTQWTWVWVNTGSWRWTGRSVVLQCMWSQRVEHHWVTELTELRECLWTLFPNLLGREFGDPSLDWEPTTAPSSQDRGIESEFKHGYWVTPLRNKT